MRTQESVLDEIRPLIADVLALEPDEVQCESRFFEDLGGESIDMLDLSFRLESFYKIKMPVAGIIGPGDIQTDAQGRITPACMERMRADYPFLDYARIEAEPLKSRMTETVTVGALAGFVLKVLESSDNRVTNPPSH